MSCRFIPFNEPSYFNGNYCLESLRSFSSDDEATAYCISSPGEIVFSEELSRFMVWLSNCFYHDFHLTCNHEPGTDEFFSKLSEFVDFINICKRIDAGMRGKINNA